MDLSLQLIWAALAGSPVPASVALLALFAFGFYRRWWVPGWLDRERTDRIAELTMSLQALSASFDKALDFIGRGNRRG